uniref:Uncharacterized protein n=1 Tax=Oryza sativa subsp. japonica TaxID=39947 RepID=Q2QRG7_ORYSJ|nr:hypothetical protein LOC_Os12g27619 [Oryza sativa Japonica Group]
MEGTGTHSHSLIRKGCGSSLAISSEWLCDLQSAFRQHEEHFFPAN